MIGEAMRWLQADAALRELLCDKELKHHTGEIGPLSGGCHGEHVFLLFLQIVALSVHSFRRSAWTFALRMHSLSWTGCCKQQRPCPDIFSLLAHWKISPVLLYLPSALHHFLDVSFLQRLSDDRTSWGHLWDFRSSSDWGWLAGLYLTVSLEGFVV